MSGAALQVGDPITVLDTLSQNIFLAGVVRAVNDTARFYVNVSNTVYRLNHRAEGINWIRGHGDSEAQAAMLAAYALVDSKYGGWPVPRYVCI